jgi:hypothetical protein
VFNSVLVELVIGGHGESSATRLTPVICITLIWSCKQSQWNREVASGVLMCVCSVAAYGGGVHLEVVAWWITPNCGPVVVVLLVGAYQHCSHEDLLYFNPPKWSSVIHLQWHCTHQAA